MFDKLKCKLGIHKPVQYHHSFRHKFRTTNKGRSKKRWYTGVRELVTVTYCEICGKRLGQKTKWIYK
jgi:hypothetical protein